MKKEKRTQKIAVHVTPKEYQQLIDGLASTTFRSMAEYMRALITREPVVKKYRNQSIDQLLEVLLDLKKEVLGYSRGFEDLLEWYRSLPQDKLLNAGLAPLLEGLMAGQTAIDHIKLMLIKIYAECIQKNTPSKG